MTTPPPAPKNEAPLASKASLAKDVTAILVAFAMIMGLVAWTLGEARADGAKAAKDCVEKLDNHIALSNAQAADFESHKKDEAENHRLVLGQIEENRKDTAALYKAVISGKRQDRLENPAYSEDSK